MNPETLQRLRPWQRGPAEKLLQILQTYDSALDASQTGVGKTYVAMAIIQALQLPCLVVAPKIAITSWLSVAEYFNEPISIINYERIRTGRTDYGVWSNHGKINARRLPLYFCLFCLRRFEQSEPHLPCPANGDGIHCVERRARPANFQGHFVFDQAVKLVIFDEVQRCSGMNSQNSKILLAAKRQHIKHLMLSATPFDTILKARAIGFSLDLFTL